MFQLIILSSHRNDKWRNLNSRLLQSSNMSGLLVLMHSRTLNRPLGKQHWTLGRAGWIIWSKSIIEHEMNYGMMVILLFTDTKRFKLRLGLVCSIYQQTSLAVPKGGGLEATACQSVAYPLFLTQVLSCGAPTACFTFQLRLAALTGTGILVWMFLGPLVLHTDHASTINNSRSRMLPQPRENAKQYRCDLFLYQWTSARFRNCTATGAWFNYLYHLNNDTALMNRQECLTAGD